MHQSTQPALQEHTYPTLHLHTMAAAAGPGPSSQAHMSALLLPGQPVPSSFTKEPRPFIGAGCYEAAGGKVLASIVGRARRDGSVSAPSAV